MTDKSGKLAVTKTPNAVLPVVEGKTPVLTCDVWEVSVEGETEGKVFRRQVGRGENANYVGLRPSSHQSLNHLPPPSCAQHAYYIDYRNRCPSLISHTYPPPLSMPTTSTTAIAARTSSRPSWISWWTGAQCPRDTRQPCTSVDKGAVGHARIDWCVLEEGGGDDLQTAVLRSAGGKTLNPKP